MEKDKTHRSRVLRYPLFLIGLAVIVLGGIAGEFLKSSTNFFVVIAVVGFAFLTAAVLVR
jgi:hypothetical protein